MSLELFYKDLKNEYVVTRKNFLPDQCSKDVQDMEEISNGFCTKEQDLSCVKKGTEETYKDEYSSSNVKAPQQPIIDGGMGCDASEIKAQDKVTHFIDPIIRGRNKYTLLEDLVQNYNYQYIIEFPSKVSGQVKMMLNYAQPELFVSFVPDSKVTYTKHELKENFETIISRKNASTILTLLKKSLNAPAVIIVNIASESTSKSEKLHEYLEAAFQVATDKDMVLVEGSMEAFATIHKKMCKLHQDWRIYKQKEANMYLTKHQDFKYVPIKSIAIPRSVYVTEKPVCDSTYTKVDVILMTRNRPQQAFGFLDSLTKYVKNVNKVWMLYRADDSVFEEGYNLAMDCVRKYMDIEGVRDPPGEFGNKLNEIVLKSEAQYLILGVDEVLWLDEVDVQYAACLLKSVGPKFFSVQLRLGKKIGSYPKSQEVLEKRFFTLKYDHSVLAYYSKSLHYDMAYILHVDGMLLSKTDFLADLGDHIRYFRHPGNLENGWMRRHLYHRSRQWHLMFDTSKLVNNMVLHDSDGRMADHTTPVSDKAYETAKRFLKDHEKIDVEAFSKTMDGAVKSTHITVPYVYTKLQCNN